MDELVSGQDYWVNSILHRPVNGLVTSPIRPAPTGAVSQDAQGIDVTDAMVKPVSNVDETTGGLSVIQFFAMMMFISIVYYVFKKMKEAKGNQRQE